MSSFWKYWSLFSMLIVIAACTKDVVPDPVPNPPSYNTLEPFSYFPAYPGSFWKYVDSNGDTTLKETAPSYQADHYTFGSAAYVSDTFLVPFYDGIPIWGYEAHTGPISNSGSYPFTRIVSDSLPVGSSWFISYWSGTAISRKIIAKDTSLVINGNTYAPTIAVEEYFSQGPSSYIWLARRFYTKNIGLVREDIFNTSDSTVNTKELIDFFVNH